MNTRLPCAKCGDSIHPDTAAKNGGLCMPCKGGYRDEIEAGKLRRAAERTYDQSAERKYWLELVNRIYHTKEGFAGISPTEKTYYAVCCLVGEVYNGGFDQFFSNSTGDMYGVALDGLFELEADATAAILIQTKEVLFGSSPVPVDRSERMKLMPTILRDGTPESRKLEALDTAFYADPDQLGERCKAFAIKHGLYTDG
jgi:hypothetical protein